MNAMIKFIEHQTRWMSKIVLHAVIIGSVCFIAGLIASENGGPLSFLLITAAMWCYCLKLICELFEPNEQGESKVGSATLMMQVYSLAFFVVAIAVLLVATVVLLGKLIN